MKRHDLSAACEDCIARAKLVLVSGNPFANLMGDDSTPGGHLSRLSRSFTSWIITIIQVLVVWL